MTDEPEPYDPVRMAQFERLVEESGPPQDFRCHCDRCEAAHGRHRREVA